MSDTEEAEALKLMDELVSDLLLNPNDEWTTLNQVCDLAMSDHGLAKEATRVIRRLIASPPSQSLTQLKAIRFWAILFHRCPSVVVGASTAPKFVDAIDNTMKNPETTYRVREKLLLALGSYVHEFAAADNENPLTQLWRTHKQPGQPYQGLYIASTNPYLNPLANSAGSLPSISTSQPDQHTTVPLIRTSSLPERTNEHHSLPQVLPDHHLSLSRPQRMRNGGSRSPSPSPSPIPILSRSPTPKPRDPDALIAGPAYSNGSGRSLAPPSRNHLHVEEPDSPSLRKRLSSGMLGGLFKGLSNEPVQESPVVYRGQTIEEIPPSPITISPTPLRQMARDELPLFPPERYAATPPPRSHSTFPSLLQSSNPSEASGGSAAPASSPAQDLFSYVRSLPDPGLTLHMPISELCRHIRAASTSPPNSPQSPTSAHSLITWLSWYKETGGVKHEFVTLKVKGIKGERDFWMRFDRSAARGSGVRKLFGSQGGSHMTIKSVSSIYQANDTVMLSGDEKVLLSGDSNNLLAKVRFQQPPMLSDLEALLTVVEEESAEYDLFRENCYFFCSVVQQILTEIHEGYLAFGKFRHQSLGADARRRIVNRLRQRSMPWTPI